MMTSPLKTLLSGCGAAALAVFWSGAAMAQYYSDDGYGRRYERRNYDRGYDRGYERARREQGYGQGYGYGQGGGYGYGRGNAVNRMTIEEQKQAVKNHREAQKKAIKRGYVIP
jgi:hypothetical protein